MEGTNLWRVVHTLVAVQLVLLLVALLEALGLLPDGTTRLLVVLLREALAAPLQLGVQFGLLLSNPLPTHWLVLN